jgi:uncharacterized protein (TIGR00369 family)
VDKDDVIQIMLENIPHVRDVGLQLVTLDGERATLKLEMQDHFVGNPDTGVIHGGIVTVALDTACGMAVLSAMAQVVPFATLDLRLDYLKQARPMEAIYASAHCYKLTRSVAFTRGVAYQDSPDDPIANCVGTFMIQSPGAAMAKPA